MLGSFVHCHPLFETFSGEKDKRSEKHVPNTNEPNHSKDAHVSYHLRGDFFSNIIMFSGILLWLAEGIATN